VALLNAADALRVGGTAVDKVYAGADLIWPTAPTGPSYFDEVMADTPLAYWRLGDTPASVTATASTFFSAGTPEPPSNAIDGNTSTYWTTAATQTGWLRLQLGAPATLTAYSIRRRDDIPSRNPTAWTFEGSNDGTTWDVLDTRSGITWPTGGETKPFTFTNTTPYAYYRLNVTANGGDGYLSVNELGTAVTPVAASVPIADSSGNARHGTSPTALVPTLGAPSLLSDGSDAAATFDGSSNYVSVPDAAWMRVGTITLEALVRPTVANRGSAQTVIDRDTSTRRTFQFNLFSDGKVQLIFWTTTSGPHFLTGSTALSSDTTSHVVATYDGTTARVYLNGVQDGSLDVAGTLQNGTGSTLAIGASRGGATETGGAVSNFFGGRIDEVAYYGTALSAARIAAHAAAR
jgi:hypothetical protein